MINESMSIIRDAEQDYLPIPLPGAEGVYVKVLKADEEMDRVVVKIKFDPGTRMPEHPPERSERTPQREQSVAGHPNQLPRTD